MGSGSSHPIGKDVRRAPLSALAKAEPDIAEELTFALVNVTEYGKASRVGWEVVAVKHDEKRVLIEHRSKSLGEVPDEYAAIIAGLPRGTAFAGIVILADPSRALVTVHLKLSRVG